VLVGAERIVIVTVALLMIVGELGINIVPLIAGLGIGGIAIGLGAQSLVRDAINGVLILTENQFGKGDMVKAAGVQGWVEEVNLRRTVLRDVDGTLHSVPNSEIKVSSNLTRGYSGVDLIVSVGAGQDVDQVVAVIDRAGHELRDDPDVGDNILEPPRVARIEHISPAGGVDLRVTGRVTPGWQWKVTSALRRSIIREFDARGIRFGPPPAPPAPPAPPTASTLPAPPPAASSG
jgi:small conductance mechanosensitive channel